MILLQATGACKSAPAWLLIILALRLLVSAEQSANTNRYDSTGTAQTPSLVESCCAKGRKGTLGTAVQMGTTLNICLHSLSRYWAVALMWQDSKQPFCATFTAAAADPCTYTLCTSLQQAAGPTCPPEQRQPHFKALTAQIRGVLWRQPACLCLRPPSRAVRALKLL